MKESDYIQVRNVGNLIHVENILRDCLFMDEISAKHQHSEILRRVILLREEIHGEIVIDDTDGAPKGGRPAPPRNTGAQGQDPLTH